MSDPSKQQRIEEFLRKSLLGEELINTQFHLFSARSSPSRRVTKPRVLCANNVLLAKSSKYFLDLLSSDISPSDPSLIDLTGDNDVPSNAKIDDYGYGSDSDLDDCNDPIPAVNSKAPKNRSKTRSTVTSKIGARARNKDDDELFDDGSDSDGSDIFVMSPEEPRADIFAISVTSSETVVPETLGNKASANQTAMRLRSLGSRHILVKDTAFQTWYTLLNYLYTGKFSFLPLGSAAPGGQPHESSTSSLDEPKCSAKSMYRLASKAGLDDLREEAFSYIKRNLNEHNILKELSSSLVSKHPQLLEMELDVLYSHIASAPVVADFPALARRIANKELPHGADIIVGIHTRLLKEPHPLPLRPSFPVSTTSDFGPPVTRNGSEMPTAATQGQPEPPPTNRSDARPGFLFRQPPTWASGSFGRPEPAGPAASSNAVEVEANETASVTESIHDVFASACTAVPATSSATSLKGEGRKYKKDMAKPVAASAALDERRKPL